MNRANNVPVITRSILSTSDLQVVTIEGTTGPNVKFCVNCNQLYSITSFYLRAPNRLTKEGQTNHELKSKYHKYSVVKNLTEKRCIPCRDEQIDANRRKQTMLKNILSGKLQVTGPLDNPDLYNE